MPYIGIFGGTFDPIHLGHLAAAEGAMHLAGLDQVVFMPNWQSPLKVGLPLTTSGHRATMVRLAISGNPRFAFSDLELQREAPSYTLDTARALQLAEPDWRLALIVGMDSLEQIEAWYEYRVLLGMIDLLVVTRPGYGAASEAVMRRLGSELTRRIRLLEVPGIDVSASDLRERAERGYPLRYLVPDTVVAYIQKHRLYGGQGEHEGNP